MPRFVLVPSENVMKAELLPEPSMHIFYDRRVADIDDGLPKHHGFMASQLAFGSRLINGAIRAR